MKKNTKKLSKNQLINIIKEAYKEVLQEEQTLNESIVSCCWHWSDPSNPCCKKLMKKMASKCCSQNPVCSPECDSRVTNPTEPGEVNIGSKDEGKNSLNEWLSCTCRYGSCECICENGQQLTTDRCSGSTGNSCQARCCPDCARRSPDSEKRYR